MLLSVSHCVCLLFLAFNSVLAQRGEFPSTENLAPFKPVSSSSICGATEAESYCLFTTNSGSSFLPNCIARECNNTCPFGDQFPSPIDLISLGTFGESVETALDGPGSDSNSVFINSSFISVPFGNVVLQDNGFSFAVWVNIQQNTESTLISRSNVTTNTDYFVITISQMVIRLYYRLQGSVALRNVDSGVLDVDLSAFWNHVTITVYLEDVTYYINGSVVSTSTLDNPIVDGSSLIYLGEATPGTAGFVGHLQDAYFYTQALVQRDVQLLGSGVSSFVHLAPECRCPASHPVVDSSNTLRCIQHTGHTTNRGMVQRINQQATPPGYINNQFSGDQWISEINEQNATISMKLSYTDFNFEVFYVLLYFGSPRPKAAILKHSVDQGENFLPLQYFADNCMEYFNVPDGGTLNGVTCITSSSSQLPTAGASIQYVIPSGSGFSSDIQMQFVDVFNNSQTSIDHLYYSLTETTIVGRCNCNGHGARCTINEQTSSCQCTHNAEGTMCERCQPLFNDKPWRMGTSTTAFPCKSCSCNNHATSCYYNQTLDSSPDSHDLGGGGVCNCVNNTAGQHCDTCVEFYYRPVGRDPSDPDACIPCDCNSAGIVDDGDCVKSDDIPGQVAGKCNCKTNVEGIQCDACKSSFYNLSASNTDGCQPCNCNLDGTVGGSAQCDRVNGQCSCKSNVIGLRCDQCTDGTAGLDGSNPDGCSMCQCDTLGSNGCDSLGTCQCKSGVTGTRCDQCEDGFYNLTNTGCQPCQCHPVGAASAVCNKIFGNCTCTANVVGNSCDECDEGLYDISQGCVDCGCNTAGSISSNCDSNGQCMCKSNVDGRACDECIPGTTNLQASNVDGCSICDCFIPNTLNISGSICNATTSQCNCQLGATGLMCDSCIDGYYATEQGCVECVCDSNGSLSSICNATNGLCSCRNNFVGDRCEQCNNNFYQYPVCQPCGCNAAGSTETNCTSDGQCSCKEFVDGLNCDVCLDGFMFLEAENPQGCSAAPEEQGPPTLRAVNFSTVLLTWRPPESPNGEIISYIVYRDNVTIANVTVLNYTDTGLQPITQYSYVVEAINRVGSTRSASLPVTTLDGIPEGVRQPSITFVNSTAVTGTWNLPLTTNGQIVSYILQVYYYVNGTRAASTEVAGNRFVATVGGLTPFTDYSAIVVACTNGGCAQSSSVTFITTEASPLFQTPPTIATINSSAINVSWLPPQVPNGILVRYEVILTESNNESVIANITSDLTQYLATGLNPATQYGFSVTSYTNVGGTQSETVYTCTDESVPAAVRPLDLAAISATSIRITWFAPDEPNGNITLYRIIMINPRDEVVTFSTVTGTTVVTGLLAFTSYSLLLEVCTEVGCTNSTITTVTTHEIAPVGQRPPMNTQALSTALRFTWTPPEYPNGIINSYLIQRRNVSLVSYPYHHERGVFFTGTDFAEFMPVSDLTGYSTDVSLYIRTFQETAALLYTRHTSNGEFIAIQLRGGRLWFMYDPGSGPAAISPQMIINDGMWHKVVVSRNGTNGMVTIDDVHTASGSSLGLSEVVGSGAALYIGGIREGVSLLTNQNGNNENATLTSTIYAGCLRNVYIGNVMLSFATVSEMMEGMYPLSVGCPTLREKGIHFYGGGYVTLPNINILISNEIEYSVSIGFRTTSNTGVIYLAYSEADSSILAVYLQDGILRVLFFTSQTEAVLSLNSVSFSQCDGLWKSVTVTVGGGSFEANSFNFEDNASTMQSTPLSVRNSIALNSYVYLGGFPMNSSVRMLVERYTSIEPYFGGCLRNVLFNGSMIDIVSQYSAAHLVNFAGCPVGNADQTCTNPTVFIDGGLDNNYIDEDLNPFTGYLHKVVSFNSAGNASSSWIISRTASDVPTGVATAVAITQGSNFITVSWSVPTYPNGILTGYAITAIPVRPTWGFASDLQHNGSVSVNTTELQAMLSSLQTSTIYSVMVTAYTDAGGSTGSSVEITTSQAAPEGVGPPRVTAATTTSITFSWSSPLRPNGDIVNYILQLNSSLLNVTLAGDQLNYTASSLMSFTAYQVTLTACTVGGCTTSSMTTAMTLPGAPSGLAAPNATALSAEMILVNWEPPDSPNGGITLYQVLQVFTGADVNPDPEVLANTTDLMALLTGLLPNTLYTLAVVAHNDGGSTTSPTVDVLTPEGVPEGIAPPVLAVVNSTAIRVTWDFPQVPNGQIIEFRLIQDLSAPLIFFETTTIYVSSELEPFSTHTYIIQACTRIGCGSSVSANATTLEAIPDGITDPNVHTITANSFVVTIQGVTNPNGLVQYFVYVIDDMEAQSVAYNSSEPTDTSTISIMVNGLLPFSTYIVEFEAMNGAGSIIANQVNVTTAEADPTSLSAPNATVVNSTAVLISWDPPIEPNGIVLGYNVSIRLTSQLTASQVLSADVSTMLVVTDLTPFTNYETSIIAYNSVGSVTSNETSFITGQSVPVSIDSPEVTEVQSRSLILSWDPPSIANGIIIHYIIMQNSTEVNRISPNITTLEITDLLPFVTYQYTITACTVIGCTESPPETVTTLEAVPEDFDAPIVRNTSFGMAEISWEEPRTPNGIIIAYYVQRALMTEDSEDNTTYTTIATVLADVANLVHIDNTAQPFTLYNYRITAENGAGFRSSPFTSFVTLEAAPENVTEPTVVTIDGRSLLITWDEPLIPNGIIRNYTIKRINPDNTATMIITLNTMTFNYTDQGLRPFTSYSYTITATTAGGSTESEPSAGMTAQEVAFGLTPPSVTAVNSTTLFIAWNSPSQLNGILQFYRLYQQLPSDDSNETLIFEGLDTSFDDTDLTPYTDYQYYYEVVNGAGVAESALSAVTRTLADVPLQGPISIATVINSTAILLSWDHLPSNVLQGPLVSYEIQWQSSHLSQQAVVENISADVTAYNITELLPNTEYTFRVFVFNGVAQTGGPESSAITLVGIPANVVPPTVIPTNSTTLSITWQELLTPNGEIVLYSIFVNSLQILNATSPDTFLHSGLSPFTNYTVQLQACTEFGCNRSALVSIATLEASPVGLAPPIVTITSSTAANISWDSPLKPNGIITEYQLQQRMPAQCPYDTSESLCTYVECPVGQSQCGTQCYRSSAEVCCEGVVYNITAGSECCNANYITKQNIDDVCCGGRFHARQENFECCNDQHILVLPGSVCCTDDNGELNIGNGDSCCGGAPYTDNGNFVCCGETLQYNHTSRLCCRDVTISLLTTVCCNGIAFLRESGKECCGSQYVETDTTLCCTGSNGISQVFSYASSTERNVANEQCCESNKIPGSLECCNGIPYNGSTQVCADRPTLSAIQQKCGTGTICNTNQEISAYCDRCNFNPAGTTCGVLENVLSTPTPSFDCFETTIIFTGLAFNFQALNLIPYTSYGFSISAINSAGNLSTTFITMTTLEAAPSLVDAPIIFVESATTIRVTWVRPVQANGILTNYSIYQNESFVNSTLNTNILIDELLPFTTYQYFIEACTNAVCTQSNVTTATTMQSIPEGLEEPSITVISPTEIRLDWSPPQRTNGIITLYTLNETQDSNTFTVFQHSTLRTVTLTDRSPFTTYYFVLQACNIAGCVTTSFVNVTTPQAPPENILPPTILILTSTAVDVSWRPPNVLNGEIITYILRRDNEIIFNGTELSYSDDGLAANTQFNYTIEVVNGGGSIVSGPTFLRTPEDTPDGLVPPNLIVINSTAIQVTWDPPASPNGIITSYSVLYNNLDIEVGISFAYVATGLLPAIEYSFRIEACTRLGCAVSMENVTTTDDAVPSGLGDPLLTSLGSTAIRVEWMEPQTTNGVILRYEVYRRETGSQLQSLQFSGSQTMFINSGLLPFTGYEYRIRAINSAGSVFSEWIEVYTLEDIPQGINGPIFTAIFARNITLNWMPPTFPNGVIMFYEINQREIGGMSRLAARVSGNVTTTTITELMPARFYEFQMVVINNAGENESPWVPVGTIEAPPENLQPIRITARPSSGTSLVLEWDPPLVPNGIILEYIIYLNNGVEFRGSDNTYTVQRLSPFTTYILQLEVCNSAGCSRGMEQNATTAEISPVGQQAPELRVLSANIIQLTWEPPEIPNGIIIQYDIIRQLSAPFGTNANISTATIFSNVSDVITRVYVDSSLQPFTFYEYAIRAINSAGQTIGPFATAQTSQSIPEEIPIPTLEVTSPSDIRVSWNSPATPNGIITEYRVVRNGLVIRSTLDQVFLDIGLLPFTEYSYSITACTIAGCGNGSVTTVRTMEATPAGVRIPTLTALSNTSIAITWMPPAMANGIINRYTAVVLPVGVNITTLQTNVTVQNLSPFTIYQVSILACTQVGCTLGPSSEIRTLEGIPRLINSPQLLVLGPTVVESVWAQPLIPNGIIIAYELWRNDTTVFVGNETMYIDRNVMPNQVYCYTVRAYTSIGAGEFSQKSIVMTSEDTPSGINPPTLTVLSATSIRANWEAPLMPNGNITEYRLIVNGRIMFTGLQFTFIATELNPFTSYVFQLMACTTTCGSSERVIETTLEAAPTGQNPPQLVAVENNIVLISWTMPSNPNGIILRYSLERQIVDGDDISEIFNGLDTTFNDTDNTLVAAMYYEYRVTSFNSVGNDTSNWTQILLLESTPEGIPQPIIFDITPTSVTLNISSPLSPNGVITMYNIVRNGITVATVTRNDISYSISNLAPYTVYAFHIEACTVVGCGQSDPTVIRTLESRPLRLLSPNVSVQTPRSLFINWTSPSEPNGEIIRYTLWYRISCPQPPQPFPVPACTPGDIIQIFSGNQTSYTLTGTNEDHPMPYSRYQFLLQAENSVSGVNSSFSDTVETFPSSPEVIDIVLFSLNDNVVSLNWGNTFRLNGKLRFYILTRNNFTLHQDILTSVELANQPRGERLVYAVTVVTEAGQITAREITTQISVIIDTTTTMSIETTSPTSTDITTATPDFNVTEIPTTEEPVQNRPEFIIGMVVLGLVIIFVICVVLLCFVRPKDQGDGKRRRKQPLTYPPYSGMLTPSSTATFDYSSPQSEHGWIPNQPPLEGTIEDTEALLAQRGKTGYYSPHKAQQRMDTQWQNDYVDVTKSELSNAYSDESEQQRLASSTGIIAYDNQTFADTHL